MYAISNRDLAVALVLVAAALGLAVVEQLGLVRDILVGTLRAYLQLTAIGLILGALFRHASPEWVLLALAVMIGAAVQAAGGRVEGTVPALGASMAVAIGSASLATLAVVVEAVVRPGLWYDPRVVIPLAGMVIGNSMTTAALAANRFAADLRARQDEVEALLALGATRDQAIAPVARSAIRAALVPSVASMMVVGIVSLPGMMTGQILAGANPAQAVRYQIVVQYMLVFAAVVTASLQVRLIQRQFFTPAHQLRLDLLRAPARASRRRSLALPRPRRRAPAPAPTPSDD